MMMVAMVMVSVTTMLNVVSRQVTVHKVQAEKVQALGHKLRNMEVSHHPHPHLSRCVPLLQSGCLECQLIQQLF